MSTLWVSGSGAVDTVTVLFAVGPVALIGAAVLPGVDTETVLAVVDVLTIILTAIFPGISAASVHVVLAP